jgi:uncharacterized protein (TIRG00374 family)
VSPAAPPPVASKHRRLDWKWPVSLLLAAVLLYLSLRGVDWGRVWFTISTAHWEYFLAAALLTCVSSILRSLRWRILLNAEADLSVWTVYRATMAGYLGNNFLPARAGEVIRSLLIARRSKLSKTYVFTTAMGERLMDVVALALASSIVLMTSSFAPRWMARLSKTGVIVAATGALAAAVIPHTGDLVIRTLERIRMPAGLRDRLIAFASQAMLGLRAFHHWGRFWGFALFTAVIWTCDTFSIMVGSRALDLHLTFSMAMLLLTGLGLGSALPSAPGYVGIFQFVAVSILKPFGVPKDSALAYILVTQAIGLVVVALMGIPAFSLLREARKESAEAAEPL